MPLPHPFYLQDPEALITLAHDLFDARDRKHWSVKATVLGRITDERRHPGYDSAETWAREQLDLSAGEYRLALKLWRLMRKAHAAGVQPEDWHQVSKGKALLLCEVLDAGGEPRTWFERAVAFGRREAFQAEVDRHLERQTWVTLRVKLPSEVRDLFREACQRALPYVVQDPGADLATWDRPEHLFRCLELLAMKFTRDTPVMGPGGEEDV